MATSVVFRIQDARLDESSSLVDGGRVMVSANDSGHDAVLFVLDARTGATLRTVRYAAAQTDVEALAPAGRQGVWVGDIGDNLAQRSSITVRRVALDGGRVASYRLRYPDGAHDAEALFLAAGRLHVITKGIFGGHAYVAPRRLHSSGINRLHRVGPTLPALVTDAAAFPGGKNVLVRTYGEAFAYAVPSWRRLGAFRLPRERQGESVSIGGGGRIRMGSEGVHSRVLEVTLPARIRARLHPPAPPRPVGAAPAPDHAPWWPWALGGIAAAATAGLTLRPALSGRRRRAAGR
ncbi:MAG: hypothetical protein ACTHNS_01570 [Marmoricola sp.]